MSPPEPDVNIAPLHSPSHTQLTHVEQSESDHKTSPSSPFDGEEADTLHRSDTLSFPTLEPDGSLPHLAEALVSTRRYRTPPAALSSLGAKARMAENQDVDFTDSQYDMLDDVSVVSSDDRETASLASTDHLMSDDERQMTPEEGQGDEFLKFDAASVGHLAGTLQIRNQQRTTNDEQRVAQENDLMDSYMTDDLETPRQSTMRPPHSSSQTPALPTAPSTTETPRRGNGPLSLDISLYCSHADDFVVTARRVGSRIARCLGSGQEDICHFVDLPATPNNTCGALLARYGDLDITIHGTDVDQLTSLEETASSLRDRVSDLSVLFLSGKGRNMTALADIMNAVAQQNVPIFTIADSDVDLKQVRKHCDYSMCISKQDFYYRGQETLRQSLCHLLPGKLEAKVSKNIATAPEESRPRKSSMLSWVNYGMVKNCIMVIGILLLVQLGHLGVLSGVSWYNHDPARDLVARRAAVSSALVKATNTPNAPSVFDVTHLVPDTTPSTTDYRSMAVPPKSVAVSVLGGSKSHVSTPYLIRANGSHGDIHVALTEVVNGIYILTIPSEEAYGHVDFHLHFQKPRIQLRVNHDYGTRYWQRNAYKKAGTDLAKVINKDVTIARDAARTLTYTVGLELSASVAATRDVTTQLAVRMTRDVQVFVNTAASVFGNWASKTAGSTAKVSTDLTVVRQDLIKRIDDAKKSVATTARSMKDLIIPKKRSFTSPLALSRQRAIGLKESIVGKHEGPDTPPSQLKDNSGHKPGRSWAFSRDTLKKTETDAMPQRFERCADYG